MHVIDEGYGYVLDYPGSLYENGVLRFARKNGDTPVGNGTTWQEVVLASIHHLKTVNPIGSAHAIERLESALVTEDPFTSKVPDNDPS